MVDRPAGRSREFRVVASKSKRALVIVESPAKAKKIGSFLGNDYIVRASVGHIRDLPAKAAEVPEKFKKESWATLGVNVEHDFEPLYIVSPEKRKVIKELKDLLKEVEELIIATDEDREGESIGWHLVQVLEPKIPTRRMVFSEITKPAILQALASTRHIDENLVAAQETRRVVDRLYGYTLSPLLWKKIARGLSAGRVQSVAVRLIAQREIERMLFRSGEYWDLDAALTRTGHPGFTARLVSVDGKRVATGKDFDESTGRLKAGSDVTLLSEADARAWLERLQTSAWSVKDVEKKQQARRPSAPFTTSTLQQESNRKLGLSAQETMRVAQRLYEDGHITYMRTDSVSLSAEAVKAARDRIESLYGKDYLSDGPRTYANKQKNAQEAHEAIRPAGTQMLTADEIGVSGVAHRLYTLIWKRTVASQMADAQVQMQAAVIAVDKAEFRASGRHVLFPGFFRAYVEGVDDPEAALDDQDAALPPLEPGNPLDCTAITPQQHHTKPPARFTEATLVRTLEAEGVGRPSTYASIIGTIQDRGYVRKENNQLIPTFTALAVTKLLEKNFPRLVDLRFTAEMEQSLDDISNGATDRLPYLRRFYQGQEGLVEQVKAKEEGIDPREACTLSMEGLNGNIRVGRYGPYLERSSATGETETASLPNDISPADVTPEMAEKLFLLKQQGPQALGMHPEEGLPIFVLVGPFGPYLQLGENKEGAKPKRVSIPPNIDPMAMTFELALQLIELPRTVGQHPEDGKVVKAGIGRFGPYVLHDGKYKSLGKEHDVLTIDLPTSVELLAQAKGPRRGATPVKELGPHPQDQQPVQVFEGRYGAYVKHGDINATLPKDVSVETIEMELAVELLAARAAAGGGKKSSKKGAKKGAKTAARKTAAPKSAKQASGDETTADQATGSKTANKAAKSTKTKGSKKTATRKPAPVDNQEDIDAPF